MINPLIISHLISLYFCLRGLCSPLEHEILKDELIQRRETVRGGGNGEHSEREKHPKAKRKQQKKETPCTKDISFHRVLFPRTVPSCRSQRRGPDCTRLCSSALWKHGRSRSWSEGCLAPAEMKDRYYYKKPADATSYGADGIGMYLVVSHKTLGDLFQPLSSLFIALIP